MATNVSQDFLQCSMCTNHFREPKVLDCLHNFCLACLQKLRQQRHPHNTNTACPLCRKETALEDVTDLPNNLSLRALVEERTMQELLQKGQGSEIKCQACDEENPAISRCMDCDHFLCRECQRAHQRLTMMKSHTICTVAQLQSGEITYRSKLRDFVPKCERHPEQNLNVYCTTCQQLVCTTCSVLHHKSTEHTLTDLSEALDKCKRDIAEKTKTVEMIKTSLSNAANKIGDESLEKLKNKYAETNKKISKKADEEVAKIRAEEQKLKKKVKKTYEDRLETFESIQATNSQEVVKVDNKLDQVNQLMDRASRYEILDLKQKLLQNLCELQLEMTNRQPVKISEKSYFMDFEEVKGRSLGRVVLENEPRLKSTECQCVPQQTESTCTPCVPEFSNSEEGVVEVMHEQLVSAIPKEIQVQPNGSGIEKKPARKPGTWPKNFEVEDHWSFGGLMAEGESKSESTDKAGESVCPDEALDNFEHWVFTKLIKTFGPEQTEFRCAYDVAVFSDNEIIIADTQHKRLIRTSLMSSPQSDDISSILEIKGLTNPHHLSVNKDDQLIVIDHGKPTVKTFDRKFQLVHQFIPGGGAKIKPTCLAVDESNQIAVGYKYKKQIFLHNPNGTLVRWLHAMMIDSYLATYKQRFIYTNYWNKMLYAQDYEGNMVFSVNVPSDSLGYWGPNALCCDKNGNIYVAVRGSGSTGPADQIIRFGFDGANLGCVITGCGLPWGITIAPDDDNLVVAAKNSIAIFNRAYLG